MKPRIRVTLQGGRAEMHRVPIADLVLLLTEIQGLVQDLGRDLAGPDAAEDLIEQSCRLEVVGLAFTSAAPELELAFDTEEQPNVIGRRAMEAACATLTALRESAAYEGGGPPAVALDRIEAMGILLDRGYARIETAYAHSGRTVTGVLDHELRARLLGQKSIAASVEDVTIRGILYSIEDRPSAMREKRTFHGRVLGDAGDVWIARFSQEQADLARELWRKTVELTGRARYAIARTPVLYVEHGRVISPPDWQQALMRYRGIWKDLYRDLSFEQIMADLR